jgi:hypothetical protein
MGVHGKSYWDHEFRAFCDFGVPGRKTEIARHYSKAAADRAFKRYKRYYSRLGRMRERHMWRCWQEDRYGRVVRDTGDIWSPVGQEI